MLSNELRNFFRQLNFLILATNVPGITIMKNENNGEMLYVVLLDHDNHQIWSTGTLSAVTQQLASRHTYPDSPARILILVLTDDPARDRMLTAVQGATVWLVDAVNRKLIVNAGQDEDFFGLRYGLEKTIEASGSPKNPWDIKAVLKDKRHFPYVTVGLIIVNVIWFLVLCSKGDVTNAQFMWSMGANYGYSVFIDHEFYRLFFSMFMHFGFMHLAGNMIYLAIAGVQAERAIGSLRFFLIYILSGLAASLLSTAYYFMTEQNTVSAGASGAIYGIIGLVVYLTGRNRGVMGKASMIRRIVIVLFFLIFSNFITSSVDVVAHIAGFVFGLLLSFAFLHSKKQKAKN